MGQHSPHLQHHPAAHAAAAAPVWLQLLLLLLLLLLVLLLLLYATHCLSRVEVLLLLQLLLPAAQGCAQPCLLGVASSGGCQTLLLPRAIEHGVATQLG